MVFFLLCQVIFLPVSSLQKDTLSQGCLSVPGTSGWRFLNQANGPSRNRTRDDVVCKPTALPLSDPEKIYRRRGRPALGWNQSQTNRPPGCSTLATVDLSVSRRLYAFGFMVHYNIFKTKNVK